MAIQVKCETCKTEFYTAWENAGQTIECSKCRSLIVVSTLSPQAEAEGPPLRVVVMNSSPLRVVTQGDRVQQLPQSVIITDIVLPLKTIFGLVFAIAFASFVWGLIVLFVFMLFHK